jgi:hypothetical protein
MMLNEESIKNDTELGSKWEPNRSKMGAELRSTWESFFGSAREVPGTKFYVDLC